MKITRRTRFPLIVMAVLTAGLIAFPTVARADDGRRAHGARKQVKKEAVHYRDHDRKHDRNYGHKQGRSYDRRYGRDVRHGYRRGTVPRKISMRGHNPYDLHYAGRSYYRPHRHHHSVYRFPVLIGGRVAYRPYDYCGDSLFLSGTVSLPYLAFGVSYGSPGGFYLEGFYRSR